MLRLPFGVLPNLIAYCLFKPEIKETRPEFDVKYPFADLGKTLNDMV